MRAKGPETRCADCVHHMCRTVCVIQERTCDAVCTIKGIKTRCWDIATKCGDFKKVKYEW